MASFCERLPILGMEVQIRMLLSSHGFGIDAGRKYYVEHRGKAPYMVNARETNKLYHGVVSTF